MVSTPMHKVITALVVVGLAGMLATAGPAGAGLEGSELKFTVRSKGSDSACVSYYETTKRRGPSKHFDRVSNELVDLPFRTTVGTTAKAKHWTIAAWATDDCASTADPDGTVRCSIKVDGKRKARASATDSIAFCFV
jgi:hypothetical protein